jgi:NADH-quinone oxidoreductase subunit L
VRKFYLDEVWMFVTHKVVFKLFSYPIAWFDRHIIDGSMDGLGWCTTQLSAAVKPFQSGRVQWYALVFLVGTLAVAVIAMI